MNRIPPSPPQNLIQQNMQWGDNALTAPTTPGKRLPVIDKSKVDPNTLKAAEGMEAMFLDYMMKTMRGTVPKSEMDLENSGTKLYRSMLDSEVAKKAARAGGIGLADQIVAYLEMQRYNSIQGPSVPPRSQGGSSVVSGSTGPEREKRSSPGDGTSVEPELRSGSQVNDHRSTGGTHEGQSFRK